nr:MAG TPA: hypothetical protein [Caudoviricetes sp.]
MLVIIIYTGVFSLIIKPAVFYSQIYPQNRQI